ncbi:MULTISPECIES: hypothetical protein [unclassified Streptomyces]|nr:MULTISPECIES: hypothetical protein [unclassified Streptomyces]
MRTGPSGPRRIGFTAEHGLHLFTRHAAATALAFGDADHHSSQAAAALGL